MYTLINLRKWCLWTNRTNRQKESVAKYTTNVKKSNFDAKHQRRRGCFWSMTKKFTNIPSWRYLDPSILQLLNEVHLLVMDNVPTKFEVPGLKRSTLYWMETHFQLNVTTTLTFDPLTSKSIGFICWSWPTCLQSLKSLGLSALQILVKTRISAEGNLKVTMTLTFD